MIQCFNKTKYKSLNKKVNITRIEKKKKSLLIENCENSFQKMCCEFENDSRMAKKTNYFEYAINLLKYFFQFILCTIIIFF